MARYSKSSSKSNANNKSLVQQVVLPTYKLDSNLVLLPGIIYNVTFSRFKAAALLYRFKDLVSQVSIINNLLSEYNFDDNNTGEEQIGDFNINPSVISNDAINGITQFFNLESLINKKTSNEVKVIDEDNKDTDLNNELGPINEFDWLTLAVSPNLDRIRDGKGLLQTEDYANVVTIVKIVGIVDDTTNIKLTLQAVTRGVKLKDSKIKPKNNESLVLIDRNNEIMDLKNRFKTLKTNYNILYKSIDKFLTEYRQALNNNSSSIKSGNLTLAKDEKENEDKTNSSLFTTKQDLLTLNPLANALYLQLAGSKNFNKAFHNLQRLYSQFHSSSTTLPTEDLKINSKTFLRLIDLTTAILPFPNYEKLKLLNKYKIEERIELINEQITLLNKIFDNLKENNSFANNWFHNEASNMQRANVVANQLKSIRILLEGMTNRQKNQQRQQQPNQNNQQRQSKGNSGPQNGARLKEGANADGEEFDELDDDNDELRAITNFIKNKLPTITTLSPDSKRLIVKDFKRIKSSANSPGGGNSDFHVIRNYLEIVMDIPWDKYVTKFKTNKEIDLVSAKTQLDKDHYGLEHVKKRLIQYLVVLKLLGIHASKNVDTTATDDKQQDSNNQSNFSGSGNIVIANGDETYHVNQKAQNQNKKSIGDTSLNSDGILESIKISKNNKSPIIALSGPPGIGKTSIAKSIASALGRNFQRLSLGGIKDESEIRGHRRTYVGAMPGLIIQALRKARCMNPVILLDEIDKVVGGGGGSKFNGDPSAALLEVLDPEQNSTFIDHYLGFPVDLSQVIFICTANEPYNMTRPLLDRLEMIEMGAYDYNEKLVIGQKYLLPRQIKRNGFPVNDNENESSNLEEFIKIDNSTLKKIIIDYTREAGVRNFERKLGTLCRFKAVEYCECLSNESKTYNPNIDENDLSIYLGVPFASGDLTANDHTSIGDSKIGVVNGLSYNSEGSGSVLVFESVGFDRRTGTENTNENGSGATLNMTGRLGETLMESGKIGLIFIKSMIFKNLLKTPSNKSKNYLLNKFNNLDIHMHVPMGGIPKDGPSAGITMTLSFLSVLLEKPVPSNIAMTGEITLRGLVLPIGGIKEKMLGAHLNNGINKMIVPRENRKDLIEEYFKMIQEDGIEQDNNLLNEILKDNEFQDFKLDIVEKYYQKKYGIELNYAHELYDVIKIAWCDDVDEILQTGNNQRMIEYRI
ncbi:hypothetical protein KGF54_002698 [Candida jiufengensis]|uniref:uncharacterized protein n=1 Tax=Candida jiufengensis TaxID=497108 RepID=UPI0022258B0D|nr:uncharacterized protein KGF54_002698 [Candida jiufengensis]KAI5953327.1 hypothetical protein KGF54_002698 [Candida jiufengensis]